MEKKNRVNQPSSKGLSATDSKIIQDAPGGKLWPRGGRRRETACGSFPNNKPEKPVPPRTKVVGKRPRASKGVSNAGVYSGGKESAWIEEPELGSVFIPGSKKQSLNHLLNFQYAPPREHNSRRGIKPGHKYLPNGKHKYNKEQFIQANCQFIVNSLGDYKLYMNNPDALVDWSLIEQINLQVNENPSCPICLYPPAAAKMTRCGHIYCWSCILHYLAVSEKNWSKCPICYESIHRHDLKSVVSVPHASFNVNETITFTLMKRARGSLTAYPADDEPLRNEEPPFRMFDKRTSNLQCKLLIANQNDIISVIEREKSELMCQLVDQDDGERCFVEEALNMLQERENGIMSALGADFEANLALARARTESCNSDAVYDEACSVISMSPVDLAPAPNTKYFYFYQAADGQHIYLHAINARMLEHTYGSLEFSPRTLTGRILEKEGGSMTEELRNRLRYLQHLPVTCQFEVAEIQFQSSVISKETADFFADQVEFRKKRRQKHAREEKRREKKIADEECRQMGVLPIATNVQLESEEQFPEFSAINQAKERTDSTRNSLMSVSPAGTSQSTENSYEVGVPSFAKMLSNTKKKNDKWPEMVSSSINKQEPTKLINVTGQKISSNTCTLVNKSSDDLSDDLECEDYIPAPDFKRNFGDAIALALEKASKTNDDCYANNAKSSGKKRNKQKRLLLATSMTFNGN